MLGQNKFLPDRSIAEHIALPLQIRGFPKEKIPERVFLLLEVSRLTEKRKLLPETLNAGERQRLALAQAVASSPKILLLDEPLSGVIDDESQWVILSMLKTALSGGSSAIIVTNDTQPFASLHPREMHLEKELSTPESVQTLWKKSEGTRIMPVRI